MNDSSFNIHHSTFIIQRNYSGGLFLIGNPTICRDNFPIKKRLPLLGKGRGVLFFYKKTKPPE